MKTTTIITKIQNWWRKKVEYVANVQYSPGGNITPNPEVLAKVSKAKAETGSACKGVIFGFNHPILVTVLYLVGISVFTLIGLGIVAGATYGVASRVDSSIKYYEANPAAYQAQVKAVNTAVAANPQPVMNPVVKPSEVINTTKAYQAVPALRSAEVTNLVYLIVVLFVILPFATFLPKHLSTWNGIGAWIKNKVRALI